MGRVGVVTIVATPLTFRLGGVYCEQSPPWAFLFWHNIHMERFIQYLRAIKAEMKHVSWPTQTQTVIYTALVIGISTLVALFVSFFDLIFGRALNLIGINF